MTRWKIATVAPKQIGWAIQTRNLVIPWIEKSTDDNLKLQIYWGGVLGNDQEYLEKMRLGQLQGAGISGAGAYIACPEFNVLGLPFLFKSYDEVDYVRKVMYSTFDHYFSQDGYKLFLWLETGFDPVFSTKRPMTSVDAFRRSRIQTWFGPVEMAGLEALGATPVPLSTMDGIAAYKAGIIDSSIMPVLGCIGAQLHTLVKYVTPWKMRYSPALLLVSRDAWTQLPRQYRDNLEVGRGAVENEFISATREEVRIGMKALEEYGVHLEELSPETLADFKKRTHPVWGRFAGDLYPAELLEEMLQHLADFRKGVK
ncbi:MAG: TRAP transporter substrate-binding protein DctP [Thermodesulfobacteriota bacterium]